MANDLEARILALVGQIASAFKKPVEVEEVVEEEQTPENNEEEQGEEEQGEEEA